MLEHTLIQLSTVEMYIGTEMTRVERLYFHTAVQHLALPPQFLTARIAVPYKLLPISAFLLLNLETNRSALKV